MMTDQGVLDDVVEGDAFSMRLATLLVATRRSKGISLRTLAQRSDGRFTKDELKRLEAGGVPLSEHVVADVSEVYGADLGTILPDRQPVTVVHGLLSAGGVTSSFAPLNSSSLLTAYLRLVRSLRRQEKAPMIDLRRDDIDVLAAYLREPGQDIVDRLAALMGATRTQRSTMASMFAAGAVVIGLASMSSGGHHAPQDSAAGSLRLIPVVATTDLEAPAADAAVIPTVPAIAAHDSLRAAPAVISSSEIVVHGAIAEPVVATPVARPLARQLVATAEVSTRPQQAAPQRPAEVVVLAPVVDAGPLETAPVDVPAETAPVPDAPDAPDVVAAAGSAVAGDPGVGEPNPGELVAVDLGTGDDSTTFPVSPVSSPTG